MLFAYDVRVVRHLAQWLRVFVAGLMRIQIRVEGENVSQRARQRRVRKPT